MEIGQTKTSYWFYVWSLLILAALFWAFMQWNHPLADTARGNVDRLVGHEVNWHIISDWYAKYVDSPPTVMPAIESEYMGEDLQVNGSLLTFVSPMSGPVHLPFSVTRQGVIVQNIAQAAVQCVADGRVVFDGDWPGLGQTVIVQHRNGVQSWYGMLAQVEVAKNDWIASGEPIGTGAYVFLALKEDEKFINPLDVLTVD
jgi:stage IV sporulation protein FA